MSRFAFVQISDTHLCAEPDARLHGVAPYARLQRAVDHVLALSREPAFVLLTGDLIQDDDPRSYEHVRRLVARLGVPVHFCMGNHDVRGAFRRVLLEDDKDGEPDAPVRYVFEHEGWRFVVLDSSVAGEVAGRIGTDQLAWLERELVGSAPTIVALHHAPAPFGVQWLDEHRLADGEALLATLEAAHVRQVLFGHVHMDVCISRGPLVLRGAPSTVWRFGDGDDQPQVSRAEGGYRWVEIDGDRISSRAMWI